MEHKHYFVERQLPSGVWISEERCSLVEALKEAIALGSALDAAAEEIAPCPTCFAEKVAQN